MSLFICLFVCFLIQVLVHSETDVDFVFFDQEVKKLELTKSQQLPDICEQIVKQLTPVSLLDN